MKCKGESRDVSDRAKVGKAVLDSSKGVESTDRKVGQSVRDSPEGLEADNISVPQCFQTFFACTSRFLPCSGTSSAIFTSAAPHEVAVDVSQLKVPDVDPLKCLLHHPDLGGVVDGVTTYLRNNDSGCVNANFTLIFP